MGDVIFMTLFWIAIVGLVIWYMSRGDNSKSKQTKDSSRIQPSYRKKPYIDKEIYKKKTWAISPDEIFQKEYVSYTRINTFKTCPRMFELIYLYKYEDVSGRAAQLGSFIHEIVRLYAEQHQDNFPAQMRTSDASIELLNLYDLAKATVELTYSIPRSEIEPYINHFINLNKENIFNVESVEYECNTTIDKYSLKCIIDRIDTRKGDNSCCSIIDYKTGKPQNVKKNQLNVYAYALSNCGRTPNQLSIQFLKNGTKTSWEYTPLIHSQTEKWLLENIQKISNTQNFKRISSGLCDYCGVSEYCDMVP